MCHVSAENQEPAMNTRCGCECSCPVMLSVEEEIRSLEERKKILQDQLEVIDKKITALKSVNTS
jgi:hypothetical protein